MCNYYAGAEMQYLDWIHEDHVRPSGDLTDDDGVPTHARWLHCLSATPEATSTLLKQVLLHVGPPRSRSSSTS